MSETKPPVARAYKIVMSRGNPLQIDADEMPKVIEAMQEGKPCKVKQGIFNPSFYVEIVEDTERIQEHNAEVRRIEEMNRQDREYHGGKAQRKVPVLKPLKNIFEGVPLKLADTHSNMHSLPKKRN